MNQKQPITSVDAWNKSVKCATLLYHWQMIDGYEALFRIMNIHQKWIAQATFKHNNMLLPQLLAQLPPITGPKIWACFHVGPYALLGRALLQCGHGIAVLLKDDVFEEQYPQYIQQFKRSFGRAPKPTELCFVRSGGTQSLLKLRQCLEKGFHVLCYIDGQEGAASEKGWTTVEVHATSLDVRMGMAVLSDWSNIPLCPILMTIDNGKLVVRYRQDIQVTGRGDYPHAMQYAYQLLETLEAEEFIQWEFLPQLFDRIASESFSPVNEKDALHRKHLWLPIDIQGEPMLFNLVSKQIMTVPPERFAEVKKLREHLMR